MSTKAMQILADTVNRLIRQEGGGIYSSNAAASVASQGVSRSTFDRLRNGYKIGASAVGIDKLDGVAEAFGVEVWQLFVPGMDPRTNLPRLATELDLRKDLSEEEQRLLDAFRSLGPPERAYLLEDAKKYQGGKGRR